MQTIQSYLVNRQIQFTQHQFFQHLTDEITLEQFASVASRLSFWVMSLEVKPKTEKLPILALI